MPKSGSYYIGHYTTRNLGIVALHGVNKLCGRPPQYAPPPASWSFVLESGVRVTWATEPILVFPGFSVLDLGQKYATDSQTRIIA